MQVKGFKGFNRDFKCRNQQYKVGKTVKHKGDISLCNSGLHFCEDPLDVLAYYAPGESRFAEVSADGVNEEKSQDSKRVGKSLTIEAEISLVHLITTGIKFRLSKYDFNNTPDKATGDSGAASATGDSGAASATGYSGAASATGDSGAASATGSEGCAIALGIEGKAMGAVGAWITVAEWKHDRKTWHRIDVQTVRVDGDTIKAEIFYVLKGGKFTAI